MPEIEINNDGIMIKCTPSKSYLKLLNEITINDTINISSTCYLTDTERIVLNILFKRANITQSELANESNNTLITIKRTLLSLKKKHIIERHGANKNGYWIINENSLETISWKLGGNDTQIGGKLGGNDAQVVGLENKIFLHTHTHLF